MNCTKCDQVYEDDSYFCPNCGAPNESITTQNQQQPEPVAAAPQEFTYQEPVQVVPPPAKKKNLLWLIPVGAVLLIGLAAVAIFVVAPMLGITIFGSKAKGDGILVGMAEKSDVTDVYALQLGKSLEDYTAMLEDGNLKSGNVYEFTTNGYRTIGRFGYAGGYVEGSPYLFLSYNDDGDMALYRTVPNPKELEPIFESDNEFFALSLDKGEIIFINEKRDNSKRCYVSIKGAKAKQVTKGDDCTVAATGKVVFLKEVSKDGELTIKSFDIQGENEVVLLDEEKDVRNNAYGYNDPGTIIFFVTDDGKTASIKIIDTSNGEVLAESDEHNNIRAYDRAFAGDEIWFVAENDDDELELYTLGANGETLIESGYSMLAALDKKGENLIYIVGDQDGDQTVFVHPMKGGKDIEIMDGKNLTMYLMLWKDTVLIKEYDPENEQTTLYSFNINGSNLAELFSESDIEVTSITSPLDTPHIFIWQKDDDGLFSIFATTLGSEEGDYILEEWASIAVLDISSDGKTLLLSGKEDSDDDRILFTIDLSGSNKLIELDDDDIVSVTSAVFTADNKAVVYNVKVGDDYDDYEIRKVKTGGDEDVEILFEEALLLDVEWKVMDNFDSYTYFLNPLKAP